MKGMIKMEIVYQVFDSFWFQAIIKLILGFVLAGIIGLERSSWSKPAGFRTHALVGISSVLIMLCGEYMSKIYEKKWHYRLLGLHKKFNRTFYSSSFTTADMS